MQQILARIQAEAPADTIVSARLLPQADGAAEIEVTPIEDEVPVERGARRGQSVPDDALLAARGARELLR